MNEVLLIKAGKRIKQIQPALREKLIDLPRKVSAVALGI